MTSQASTVVELKKAVFCSASFSKFDTFEEMCVMQLRNDVTSWKLLDSAERDHQEAAEENSILIAHDSSAMPATVHYNNKVSSSTLFAHKIAINSLQTFHRPVLEC